MLKTIVIATAGSFGDVHPYLILGQELKARGYRVRIATMDCFQEKVETIGLEFARMAPHFTFDEGAPARHLHDLRNGSRLLIKDLFLPALEESFHDLSKAVEGADLLISHSLAFAAPHVAEKEGIPWISAALSPLLFFSVHEPCLIPSIPWLPRLKFLGPSILGALMKKLSLRWKELEEPISEMRGKVGLGKMNGNFFETLHSKKMVLALFSEHFGKQQPDWPLQTKQTGFLFYDSKDGKNASLSPAVEKFVSEGAPPLVFTLGSAVVGLPGDFFEVSVEAAKRMGRRCILLAGNSAAALSESLKDTPDVCVSAYEPYSLLFPKAAAVIHQGGAGTCAQALRAGVPMIVVPHSADQPDNALRCKKIGVARVIPRKEYFPDALSKALRKLESSRSIALRAKRVQEELLSSDGLSNACSAVQTVLNESQVGQA